MKSIIAPLICTLLLNSCGGMINKGAIINGQKYYDRGDYDKALQQLSLAYDDNLEAQLLKARTYEAKGQHDIARGYYTELASKHPNSAEGVIARSKLKSL